VYAIENRVKVHTTVSQLPNEGLDTFGGLETEGSVAPGSPRVPLPLFIDFDCGDFLRVLLSKPRHHALHDFCLLKPQRSCWRYID